MSAYKPSISVLPLICLLLLLIVFVIYGKSINYDLTGFDDTKLTIEQESYLERPGSISQAFKSDVFPLKDHNDIYYRPILTISFIIDFLIDSSHVKILHISNLIYFFVALVCIYLIITQFTRSAWISSAAIIFIATNPILTSTATWIPGRNDSLLCIFCLLSFYYFKRISDGSKSFLYFLFHFLFLLLALFTKENAITIIPLMFAYSLLFYFNSTRSPKNYKLILGWSLCSIFFLYFRHSGLKSPPFVDMHYLEGFCTNIYGIPHYIGKILTGLNLSCIPIIPNMNPSLTVLGVLTLAFLFVLSGNKKLSLFGLIWYVVFLLPGTIITNPGLENSFHFEHRIITSLIGFTIMLIAVFDKDKIDKYFFSIIILFSIYSGYKSYVTSDYYSNEKSFFEYAVTSSPSSSIGINGLANYYVKNQEIKKAIILFEKAVEVNPNTIENYINLALLYRGTHQATKAEIIISKAENLNIEALGKYKTLSSFYMKTKNITKAKFYVQKAYLLHPTDHKILKIKEFLDAQ